MASDSLSIKSRVLGIGSLRTALLHVLARISRMTPLQGYESCARVTLFRIFPRSRLAEPHSPPAIARGKPPSQSTPSSDCGLGLFLSQDPRVRNTSPALEAKHEAAWPP